MKEIIKINLYMGDIIIMFKKKIGAILASITLVGSLTVGCGSSSNDNSKITISGSTSVGPVMISFLWRLQESSFCPVKKGTNILIQAKC